MSEAREPSPTTPDQESPSADSSVSNVGGDSPALIAGPLLLSIAGLLSGILAGWLIMTFGTTFEPPGELVGNPGSSPPPEEVARLEALELRYRTFPNAALSFGLFGLSVGTIFGVAEGLKRRSVKSALGRGVLTGSIGLVFGAIGGIAAILVATKTGLMKGGADEMSYMYAAIGTHATAWSLTGIGLGLALPMLSRNFLLILKTAFAALGAALVAAALYSPLAAIVFPTDYSYLPVPEGQANQLVWSSLPAVLIGFAVGRIARRQTHGVA